MKEKRNILKNAVNTAASKVASVAGGDKLVDYASSKMAKRMVKPEARKYVADNTGLKDAVKSAGNVAWNTAAVTGTGVAAKGALAVKKAIGAAIAKRATRPGLRSWEKAKRAGDEFYRRTR